MPKKIEFEATVKFIYGRSSILVGSNKGTGESAYLPAWAGYKKQDKVKVTIEPIKKDKTDVAKDR